MKILFLTFAVIFAFNAFADKEQAHAPTIYLEKTPPAPVRKPKPKGPVILDARAAFEFAMGHIPEAINIRWQDYSQTQEPHKGALDPDLSLLSRKLRFLGIRPEQEVIVIGAGASAHGEEGRIAWMLAYLGIKNIKVQNVKNLNGRKTTETIGANESVSPWNPNPVTSLRIKKSEIEKILKEKIAGKTLIDVRSESDFKSGHIESAVNIPWPNFLNPQGEPLGVKDLEGLLEKNKVDKKQTLIFYSDDGVASGYATFVAFKAGLNASHYDGSYQEWK